jgi:DNA-binding MarR family transcriptional regulator
MDLTTKQLLVLDYIKKFISSFGYSPTVREICSGLGLKSPSTVQEHLKRLVSKGIITINPNKSRTIELLVENEYLKKDEKIVILPVLEENTKSITKEFLEVPSFMLNDYDSKNLYVYKTKSSIYIINNKLSLPNKPSLTLKKNKYSIEESPIECIYGNIISEFKMY